MKAKKWWLLAISTLLVGLSAQIVSARQNTHQITPYNYNSRGDLALGSMPAQLATPYEPVCSWNLGFDWDDQQIGTPALWDNGVTGEGVTVAVIDTGVDGTHVAFGGRVLPSRDFDPVNRDCQGMRWDGLTWVPQNPDDVTDCNGHGTHVAGIIAAAGVAPWRTIHGVAPNVTILPLKVESLFLSGVEDFGGHNLDPGQLWARDFAVPAGTSFLDVVVSWDNGVNDFDVTISSPTRGFNVGDNPEFPDTSQRANQIPIMREWDNPNTPEIENAWTIFVQANPNNEDNVHFTGQADYYEGSMPPNSIVDAINFAVNNGADIINCSFGSILPNDDIRAAIANAVDVGVVVVASAGNLGCIGEGWIEYPGGYEDVITVGANDSLGQVSSFSSRGNPGQGKPDVTAPGGQANCPPEIDTWDLVCSTLSHDSLVWSPASSPGFPYVGMVGTSMAAPQVSGLAALVVEYYRDHFNRSPLPMEVKALLQTTAVNNDGTPYTGDKRTDSGAGRVQAGRAQAAFIANSILRPGEMKLLPFWIPDVRPGPSFALPLKGTLCWNDPDYNLAAFHGGELFGAWGKCAWHVEPDPPPAGSNFAYQTVGQPSRDVDASWSVTYPFLESADTHGYYHSPISLSRLEAGTWDVFPIQVPEEPPDSYPVHVLVYWSQAALINARLVNEGQQPSEWFCDYSLPQVLNCVASPNLHPENEWYLKLQNLSSNDNVSVSVMSSYPLGTWSSEPGTTFKNAVPVAYNQYLTLVEENLTPTPLLPTPTSAPYPEMPVPTPGGPTPTPIPSPTPLPDHDPPVSQMNPLDRYRNQVSFTVSWTGYDVGGSGIRGYDVQWVALPQTGPWHNWKQMTTDTSAAFQGQNGVTYGFRCRAWDNSWNAEAFPTDPETITTVDTVPPASQVDTLAPWQLNSPFIVSWSGSDGAAGSGIADYDVQVCTVDCELPEDAVWEDWIVRTTATSAPFTGEDGRRYWFRCRARDNAGREESYPELADTYTQVDLIPPTSEVDDLPTYSRSTFTVSWSGSDLFSGIADYDVQVCLGPCDAPGSAWTDWRIHTTATSAPFTGDHNIQYHFRCRARDQAGNEEPYPEPGDAHTTVDAVPPSTSVNPLPAYTAQASFEVSWSGSDDLSGLAYYNIYYRDESQTTWNSWLMGVLPPVTHATFYGTIGHTYHFCSEGVDQAGNQEDCNIGASITWPIVSDAHTSVQPGSRVTALPPTIAQTTFTVSWSGSTDVSLYDVQVRLGLNGTWINWKTNVSYTQAQYTGVWGTTYYFRCRGKNMLSTELWPYDYDTFTRPVQPELLAGSVALE